MLLAGCGYPNGDFADPKFKIGEKCSRNDITIAGETDPLTITNRGWDAYWQEWFYDTKDATGKPWTHIIEYQLKQCKSCQ